MTGSRCARPLNFVELNTLHAIAEKKIASEPAVHGRLSEEIGNMQTNPYNGPDHASPVRKTAEPLRPNLAWRISAFFSIFLWSLVAIGVLFVVFTQFLIQSLGIKLIIALMLGSISAILFALLKFYRQSPAKFTWRCFALSILYLVLSIFGEIVGDRAMLSGGLMFVIASMTNVGSLMWSRHSHKTDGPQN